MHQHVVDGPADLGQRVGLDRWIVQTQQGRDIADRDAGFVSHLYDRVSLAYRSDGRIEGAVDQNFGSLDRLA